MNHLRFDRSGIDVDKAAIILAINQDGWAERLVCSHFDWLGDRWGHNPYIVLAVLKDDPDIWYRTFEDVYSRMEIHHIILRPDFRCPEGYVMLESILEPDRKL
jgi:hypothetical protein